MALAHPRSTVSSSSAPCSLDTQATAPARAASTAWAMSWSPLTTTRCAAGHAALSRASTSPTAKPSGSTSMSMTSGRSQRTTSGSCGSSVLQHPATHRSGAAESREASASVTIR